MPAEPLPAAPPTDEADEYADAALFLGMNSTDDKVRLACKAFFAAHLESRLVVSLEQVGLCDAVIWGFCRELQDAYYPFMDHLHTLMDIQRIGYEEADVRRATEDEEIPRDLPVHERLLLGMVINRNGLLRSVSPRLLSRPDLPVRPPEPAAGSPPAFPEPLKSLYRQSLALRVPAGAL